MFCSGNGTYGPVCSRSGPAPSRVPQRSRPHCRAQGAALWARAAMTARGPRGGAGGREGAGGCEGRGGSCPEPRPRSPSAHSVSAVGSVRVLLGLWEKRAAAAGSQPADLAAGRGCSARAAVRRGTARAPGRAGLAVPTPEGSPAMAAPGPLPPRGRPQERRLGPAGTLALLGPLP